MNTSAEVTLEWADGHYTFALKAKQIEELQRKCAIPALGVSGGLGAIGQRLFSGEWFYADISETIRMGIIGGGVAPVRANELIATYVDGCPLCPDNDPSGPLRTAQAIIGAAFYGLDEIEPSGEPGEPQAGTD